MQNMKVVHNGMHIYDDWMTREMKTSGDFKAIILNSDDTDFLKSLELVDLVVGLTGCSRSHWRNRELEQIKAVEHLAASLGRVFLGLGSSVKFSVSKCIIGGWQYAKWRRPGVKFSAHPRSPLRPFGTMNTPATLQTSCGTSRLKSPLMQSKYDASMGLSKVSLQRLAGKYSRWIARFSSRWAVKAMSSPLVLLICVHPGIGDLSIYMYS